MPILFLQGTSCANTPTEDFLLDEVDLMTGWQTRLLCQERIEVTKELFPVISNNQNTLKSFLCCICTHQGFLASVCGKSLILSYQKSQSISGRNKCRSNIRKHVCCNKNIFFFTIHFPSLSCEFPWELFPKTSCRESIN